MSLLEHYRSLYAYEKDCNQKMLAMLASVPEANRSDARFQRAVTLADHLAAGRERWLDHMEGNKVSDVAWWNQECELATLPARFETLQDRWTNYLARLEPEQLPQAFAFEDNGETFHIPNDVQIVQLVLHAPYHRGQIALLVDMLGGETVDTDYADWCWVQWMKQQENQ